MKRIDPSWKHLDAGMALPLDLSLLVVYSLVNRGEERGGGLIYIGIDEGRSS